MSQDYCFDHVSNYVEIINGDEKVWDLFSTKVVGGCWFFNTEYNKNLFSDKFGQPQHYHVLNIQSVWDILFQEECPLNLSWTSGGHFCVSKKQVHKRPLLFYQEIVKILENGHLTPWIIERLEHYIFDMNYAIKNIDL